VTAGHRHWVVPVGPRTLRFLQSVTVWRSKDVSAVDRSRFPYTGVPHPSGLDEPYEDGYWRLTLLGFLHGLTGLCVSGGVRDGWWKG
jgi:hypothetical protein